MPNGGTSQGNCNVYSTHPYQKCDGERKDMGKLKCGVAGIAPTRRIRKSCDR